MTKISTSDFQKGIFIVFKGEPHQILESIHVNPGKGSAFIRTKLKSLTTDKTSEFTYKSGETVEKLEIYTREMQFLYKDDDKCFFMDQKNFEQKFLSKKAIGNFFNFLKEGNIYQILIHNEQLIGMKYPKKVNLKVHQADDAVKGSTVSGAKKIVVLESGLKISVPLFIKEGDTISIDPVTNTYLERVASDQIT